MKIFVWQFLENRQNLSLLGAHNLAICCKRKLMGDRELILFHAVGRQNNLHCDLV